MTPPGWYDAIVVIAASGSTNLLGTKDTPFGASFLLGKTAFRQTTAPALTTDKMYGVQAGQAGSKQKD